MISYSKYTPFKPLKIESKSLSTLHTLHKVFVTSRRVRPQYKKPVCECEYPSMLYPPPLFQFPCHYFVFIGDQLWALSGSGSVTGSLRGDPWKKKTTRKFHCFCGTFVYKLLHLFLLLLLLVQKNVSLRFPGHWFIPETLTLTCETLT